MSGRRRSRRRGQVGITLIELLVTVAVLTTMGGAVGVAMDIGIKTLGNKGATDRLAGTHDVSSFEQQLGGDMSRAACISKSPAASGSNTVGTCSLILAGKPSACSSAAQSFLCVTWPEWTNAPSICHTAVYSASGGVITRFEYVTSASTVLQSTIHITTAPVTASVAAPGSSWPAVVTVTVTSTAVTNNPPTATLLLHPLASNPNTSAVTSPC